MFAVTNHYNRNQSREQEITRIKQSRSRIVRIVERLDTRKFLMKNRQIRVAIWRNFLQIFTLRRTLLNKIRARFRFAPNRRMFFSE